MRWEIACNRQVFYSVEFYSLCSVHNAHRMNGIRHSNLLLFKAFLWLLTWYLAQKIVGRSVGSLVRSAFSKGYHHLSRDKNIKQKTTQRERGKREHAVYLVGKNSNKHRIIYALVTFKKVCSNIDGNSIRSARSDLRFSIHVEINFSMHANDASLHTVCLLLHAG